MQFVPDAADLLAAIGRLLDDEVLGAVPAHLQHQVRVAAHLAHLVEREVRLGPANAAHERQLLNDLLGLVGDGRLERPQVAVAELIRAGDDAAVDAAAWTALVEVTRRDLAVSKPGHDAWEGS